MNPDRKYWNQQQQALKHALSTSGEHQRAIELFLSQHAMVHSSALAQSGLWSFQDEVWEGLSEPAARCIPPKFDHSIAWLLWHIARIEDVAMNLLVAGSPQILHQGNWMESLQVTVCDTGNLSSPAQVADLSARIDLDTLKAYRLAVGRRTREMVQELLPEHLKQRVQPSRLQRVLDEGAVNPAATDLIAYWGGLKIAGLLLMPPTRHNFVHLNEALRVKRKCQ